MEKACGDEWRRWWQWWMGCAEVAIASRECGWI
jgi:hypothetical protein